MHRLTFTIILCLFLVLEVIAAKRPNIIVFLVDDYDKYEISVYGGKVLTPNLDRLAREGMTMICVSHEMGFARSVADNVVFMDEGEIIESGPPETFFDNPKNDRTKLFLEQILTH